MVNLNTFILQTEFLIQYDRELNKKSKNLANSTAK